MADDSGKVVITLDLQTGQFESSLNRTQESLKETGHAGEEALGGLGLHFIAINEALELGQKALEVWHKLLESALESEKIKNQETAFKSFAQSLGVNQGALTEAVEKATKGTVTHLQAMNASMELLQAGVNARDIPALTALATNIEATSTKGAKFSDVINGIARSAEFGSGRGLKQFDLIVSKVGDRQDVVNAILEQGSRKFESMGDSIELTNKKIDTRMSESSEKVKLFFGAIASDITLKIFGDSTDKATVKIKKLEDQLKSFQDKQTKGVEFVSGERDPETHLAERIPIKEAIARAEKELADNKKFVTGETKKETEAQKELNEEQSKAKTFALELLPAQKLNAESAANRLAITQRLVEEEKNEGGVTLKTLTDLTAARKAEIEKDFAMKKLAAEAGATNEKELASKLVKIEHDKYDAIRNLRVDDTRFKQAQDAATVRQAETNMRFMENAQQQHMKVMTDSETKRYQVEVEQLRTQGLQTDQFNKKVEEAEIAHQNKMKQIKDQYNQVNLQNFKFGVASGLQSMEQQYGSFTAIVDRSTKATHNIMSKSFIEAAKGHGDAMELMKTQFLEMIGTEMIQRGTFMFLSSLWPPQPPGIAAGLGLIAAGSAIVGASGSSAPTATSSAGGGGMMTSSMTQPTSPTSTQQNKQAQIIIQGDFLNSRETANHLQDIIRQNSDTTDFSITAQGRSYA